MAARISAVEPPRVSPRMIAQADLNCSDIRLKHQVTSETQEAIR